MFRICGLDMQSQAAYELAIQGLMRPVDNHIPMVYTIKCVDFTSPEFTLGKCYNFCYITQISIFLFIIIYIYYYIITY